MYCLHLYFRLHLFSVLQSACVQVCVQIYVCIHGTNSCVSLCVSTAQCAALPHQPSSGRPNIAQRRQLLPLLSCLAPLHSIIPHSAAHIQYILYSPGYPPRTAPHQQNICWLSFFIVSRLRTHPRDGQHFVLKATDKVNKARHFRESKKVKIT